MDGCAFAGGFRRVLRWGYAHPVRRLLSPKWVLVHITVVVLVVAFLRLGWWQIGRAAGGNRLSFGYALEWPAFAIFVIFVWVKEIRRTLGQGDQPVPREARPARPRPAREGPAYDDSGDENLAAYNRYLAWLNAHPDASPRDYPG